MVRRAERCALLIAEERCGLHSRERHRAKLDELGDVARQSSCPGLRCLMSGEKPAPDQER